MFKLNKFIQLCGVAILLLMFAACKTPTPESFDGGEAMSSRSQDIRIKAAALADLVHEKFIAAPGEISKKDLRTTILENSGIKELNNKMAKTIANLLIDDKAVQPVSAREYHTVEQLADYFEECFTEIIRDAIYLERESGN